MSQPSGGFRRFVRAGSTFCFQRPGPGPFFLFLIVQAPGCQDCADPTDMRVRHLASERRGTLRLGASLSICDIHSLMTMVSVGDTSVSPLPQITAAFLCYPHKRLHEKMFGMGRNHLSQDLESPYPRSHHFSSAEHT